MHISLWHELAFSFELYNSVVFLLNIKKKKKKAKSAMVIGLNWTKYVHHEKPLVLWWWSLQATGD